MNSPSLDSAGSPVSSIDASERPSTTSNNKHVRGEDRDAMLVDENTPLPASSGEGQRKRKTEETTGKEKSQSKNGNSKDKRSTSPKILQSNRADVSDSSDDEVSVVVTSKQAKRPKLEESAKKDKSSTPARTSSATASTSKNTTTLSSSAIKDASESAVVHFKNGKLLLKQKKIDFAQQNAALQMRIEWNEFIEDVEEALDEVPEKFHPLVALMVHESDRSATELAKTVKNALNPPLTGDEDSQGDDNVDKLPLSIVTETINLLAERVNHGFRDTPAKSNVVTIDDSDSEGESSSGKDAKDERDLPKGYETVPADLRLYRWEVNKDMRAKMFECLPKEMQDKIEARAEERLAARDEAKKLLAAMSKSERKEILLKGVKSGNDEASSGTVKAKKSEKGKEKEKTEKKSKSTSDGDKSISKKVKKEEDDAATSSTEKEKAKPGRKAKELTEEEKAKKEAEQAEKEKKKAEREAAKALKDAAKAEKEAAKAEKEAAKAEKEAIKAKQEEAKKQQRNVFGAWLAKAGTSPVEVLNNPTASSSHSRHASSSSASERGSISPAASLDQAKPKPSRDYYSAFRPFYVRPNVEVAPYNRFATSKKSVKKEETEEMEVDEVKELSNKESLADFLSRAAAERIPSSSKLVVQPLSDVMTAMQECEIRGDVDAYHRLRAQLRNTDKYPIKLLKFHADVRPGYLGTWTKTSSTINGRNPFGRDLNMLDYDYDSEAEWDEDPADAEDIKEDSGDDEVVEESDDDLDGWLAGDDEVEFEAGYEGELSLAELEDDSNNPFAQPGLLEDGKKKTKKSGKPLVKKKKVTGPLIPVIRGPYWEDEESDAEDATGLSKFMSTFKISWLGKNDCEKFHFVPGEDLRLLTPPTGGTLDPFAFVEKKSKVAYTSTVKSGTAAIASEGTAKTDKAVVNGPMQVKKPEVPSELLDLFKEAVLASKSTNKPLLIEEVAASLSKQQARKVSKQAISRSIDALVEKKKKAEVGLAADGSEGCHWQMKPSA